MGDPTSTPPIASLEIYLGEFSLWFNLVSIPVNMSVFDNISDVFVHLADYHDFHYPVLSKLYHQSI